MRWQTGAASKLLHHRLIAYWLIYFINVLQLGSLGFSRLLPYLNSKCIFLKHGLIAQKSNSLYSPEVPNVRE